MGGYVCSNELGSLPDPRTVLASLAPDEGAKRHFTELLLKLAANRQVLDVQGQTCRQLLEAAEECYCRLARDCSFDEA
jgi:hypothetical protein